MWNHPAGMNRRSRAESCVTPTMSEWAATWKKNVGDQLIGVDSGVVQLSEDQIRLRNLIRTYGEDKACDRFRKSYSATTLGPNVKATGDPETWIRSWKLDPW